MFLGFGLLLIAVGCLTLAYKKRIPRTADSDSEAGAIRTLCNLVASIMFVYGSALLAADFGLFDSLIPFQP